MRSLLLAAVAVLVLGFVSSARADEGCKNGVCHRPIARVITAPARVVVKATAARVGHCGGESCVRHSVRRVHLRLFRRRCCN